jgi:tetratricopeptide (TPR) repeat protein
MSTSGQGSSEKPDHRAAVEENERVPKDDRRARPPRAPGSERTKGWGGVARHSAQRSTDDQREWVEQRKIDQAEDTREEPDPELVAQREEQREQRKLRREQLQGEARAAIERSGSPEAAPAPAARERAPLSTIKQRREPEDALHIALGDRDGTRAFTALVAASDALDNERFTHARKVLEPLVKQAPDVAEVRELYGLAFYGLREWTEAIEQLESYRSLAGSAEEHPVLADCHRAVGNYDDVEWLWDELREASPSGPIVTEGRIVTAATRAERGDRQSAVRLLEKGWKRPKRPMEHHLRRAYALADLYGRTGASTKSRELFGWVAGHDADFGDALSRSATG